MNEIIYSPQDTNKFFGFIPVSSPIMAKKLKLDFPATPKMLNISNFPCYCIIICASMVFWRETSSKLRGPGFKS